MSAAKVYLVTRQNLSPGQQAVQAAHALQEFNQHHPEQARAWYQSSNTLALLATKDEEALVALHRQARALGLPVCPFHEPDLNNQLTALALGPEAARLVRRLPLALKEVSRT